MSLRSVPAVVTASRGITSVVNSGRAGPLTASGGGRATSQPVRAPVTSTSLPPAVSAPSVVAPAPVAAPAPFAAPATFTAPAPYANFPPGGMVEPWRQMPRVGIPVFTGNRKEYEQWRAAFNACVDVSPANDAYKLLQLRTYLKGEPLETISALGYSPAAYATAKAKLERKYGGSRRQIALQLEDIERMPTVRSGRQRELVRYSELLEIAIVNLTDAGRSHELGPGTLYNQLLRKLDEKLIAQYQRWLFVQQQPETVTILAVWLEQETELLGRCCTTSGHISVRQAYAHGRNKPCSPDRCRKGGQSDMGCSADSIKDWCQERAVDVLNCTILESRTFGTAYARVTFPASATEKALGDGFWPATIQHTVRKWRFADSNTNKPGKTSMSSE